MQTQHISIRLDAFPGEQHALRVLGLAIVGSAFAYVLLVSFSIMNVIAYREAVAATESLRTSVSMLEQDYFELSSQVDQEAATSLGLVPVSEQTFVREPSSLGDAWRPSAL